MQSLTNFGAMTGAITAAWHALANLNAGLAALWVPYTLAGAYGLVSILISTEGLKTSGRWDLGKVSGAVFVAIINALVLAGAVVGTGVAVGNPAQ